ncbi:MAG: PP2C family protein-serine/threonine phosphatase [Vulcanimicrobiaceae bacterium]
MKQTPRWLSPFLRSAGTLTATAILIVALAFAVSGAFSTRAQIAASFNTQQTLQTGELTLQELLKIQLDEQNYIHEYVITHDPSYLDAFRGTSIAFDLSQAELRHVLTEQKLDKALGALDDYVSAHTEWHREVAEPLLAHPNANAIEIDKRGKLSIDEETGDAAAIQKLLHDKSTAVAKDTLDQINRTLYQRAFWLIVFGLLAVLFNAYRSRLDRQLEEERMTTQTLQRAFQSEHVPLPNCELGSAYGSASSHLAVGGDVFDVYQLSDRLALLLIADVSGKGVDAAVLTAFIKFTIRGIALRRRDPGYILAEFNTAFPRTVPDPYLFVSMFVGILDTQALRLQYASAGHDSAFIRRSNGVQQLAVTGPVLGVMEEQFDVKTVYLDEGDTIVLATDGLTEARDRTGKFLESGGAMEWIESAGKDPQDLADGLIAQVRARGGNAMRDDLAILAIRVHEPHEGEAAE